MKTVSKVMTFEFACGFSYMTCVAWPACCEIAGLVFQQWQVCFSKIKAEFNFMIQETRVKSYINIHTHLDSYYSILVLLVWERPHHPSCQRLAGSRIDRPKQHQSPVALCLSRFHGFHMKNRLRRKRMIVVMSVG